MIPGILYARVSTDDQRDKGVSIDTQLEQGKAYATLNDIHIIAVFVDDFTGTTLNRPEFIKALDALRTGKASAIISYDSDRLSRNPTDYVILRDEFLSLGVELHYVVRGKIDLADFGHMVLEDIQGRFARQWLNKILEGLRNGIAQKIKQGSVMVKGQAPYGYQEAKADKLWKLVVDEQEATIVRQIFQWYVWGDESGRRLPMGQIAVKLNDMGVPPPHDKRHNTKVHQATRWVTMTVSRIIGRETYAGVWHWKEGTDEHQAVEVPAIVNRLTWDKAQERKLQNKKGATRRHKHNALLRLRATCGDCGYKMHVNTKKRRGKVFGYYLCPVAKRKNPQYKRPCTKGTSFRVDKVDRQLWERVKALLTNEVVFQQSLMEYNERFEEQNAVLADELKAVERALLGRTQKLEKAVDTFLSFTGMTKAVLEQRIKELEQSIEDLQERKFDLTERLEAQRLSQKRMENLQTLASRIGEGIIIAEGDFDSQKEIIEILNIQATLSVEEGSKVVSAECELGPLGESWNTDQ